MLALKYKVYYYLYNCLPYIIQYSIDINFRSSDVYWKCGQPMGQDDMYMMGNQQRHHWTRNTIILTKFWLLVAQKVFILTIFVAVIDMSDQ